MATQNPLTEIGLWRSIIEMSCMQNNDEVVLYSKEEITPSQASELFPPRMFSTPRLVFSRPVYACEQQAGLTFVSGRIFTDKKEMRFPEVTRLLDDLWELKIKSRFWMKRVGFSLSKFILHEVASQFCDCMSGGMGKYALSFARYVIQQSKLDPNTSIYPGVTVEKFMKETADIPDFLSIFNQHCFSEPTKLLGMLQQ